MKIRSVILALLVLCISRIGGAQSASWEGPVVAVYNASFPTAYSIKVSGYSASSVQAACAPGNWLDVYPPSPDQAKAAYALALVSMTSGIKVHVEYVRTEGGRCVVTANYLIKS